MSDILTNSQLLRALIGLYKANARAFHWRTIIADHCNEKYGYDPADVDNDEFIDMCDGGCGTSEGMTAEYFNTTMEKRRERAIELRLINE